MAFAIAAASDQFVYDAHAYWAVDPATAYLLPEGSPDAMLYAPPVMLLFSLFGAIPWPVFATAWSVMIAICITFMAGPFTLPVTLTNPIASEITLGNIHALTGVVVIAGFRKPALWAFVLLTKVTPGVGLLWFAFRREWRNLAIALGATAIIVLPTVILTPELWVRWFNALSRAGQSGEFASGIFVVPLWARLPAAVVLLWVGARRDWAWVVPIAVTLGLPVLGTTGWPSPSARSGCSCTRTTRAAAPCAPRIRWRRPRANRCRQLRALPTPAEQGPACARSSGSSPRPRPP